MTMLKTWMRAAAYLPIYVVCVVPAALMWRQPLALALVYVVVSIGLLWWRHSRSDLAYYLVPFVMGPAGELVAVRGGAWAYADTGAVPIWLPFAWGIAGLFMKNVSEVLSGRQD